MKNIVIEGARGLGKSTITQYIRSKTTNSTLINFTGFNETGEKGLAKVTDYYFHWFNFFRGIKFRDADGDYTFIHDRFFFSEMVYSLMYKDYDFTYSYKRFLRLLPGTFDDMDIFILTTNDRDQLAKNLNRGKVALFNEVEESVSQSLIQQLKYLLLAIDLKEKDMPNIRIHNIDTTGKSVEEIGDEIMILSGLNQ